eukprot:m.438382 g.438382  ORF g.438382 m.438382 type:complete len:363 (+) comp18230_c0_seq1:168-1256(+)
MPRKKKRAKVVPQNGAAQAAENIAAAAAKLEASGKAPAVAGTVIENALLEGCPGCHFVDMDTEWVVRVRPTTAADAADRDPEQSKECQVQMIPQGDDCALLSVANFTSSKRAAYVSAVAGEADAILALSGKAGAPLAVGETAMEPEHPVPCATFVARLAPKTLIEMAEVKSECVGVSSLSFELLPHPDPTPESAAARFHQFPLGGSGPFLCTQGVGGRLTHFFPESYHAFDLRCPVGTPLLAIADGEIVEVMHDTRCTGIHCDNLTEWNSIALRVDDIVVEYLHLAPESSKVEVGSRVKAGDVLCESGQTGFAPEPHVHIEAHRFDDRQGASVLVELVSSTGNPYVPLAGKWYDATGEVTPE